MRRILKVFADFRFIRQYLKGKWYKIRIEEGSSGMAGEIEFWTDDPTQLDDPDAILVKVEEY